MYLGCLDAQLKSLKSQLKGLEDQPTSLEDCPHSTMTVQVQITPDCIGHPLTVEKRICESCGQIQVCFPLRAKTEASRSHRAS